jgi:hypothetical protein
MLLTEYGRGFSIEVPWITNMLLTEYGRGFRPHFQYIVLYNMFCMCVSIHGMVVCVDSWNGLKQTIKPDRLRLRYKKNLVY